MPSRSELLWERVDAKNYNGAIDLIKDNPRRGLVNEVNKLGVSLFNITTVIKDGNYKLIKLLEHNPQLLLMEDRLTYSFAKTELENARGLYSAISEKEFSEAKKIQKKIITGLEKIVDKLRYCTIAYALQTNNLMYLYGIVLAGGNLIAPFNNGELPVNLLKKQTDPKLKTWFRDTTLAVGIKMKDIDLLMGIKLDPLDCEEQTAKDLELTLKSFMSIFIPYVFKTQSERIIKAFCNEDNFLIEVLDDQLFLNTLFKRTTNLAIKDFVRDRAIRYAIKMDIPNVLVKLEEAGVSLSKPLLDGKKPGQLITNKKNVPNLAAWFKKRFEPIIAKNKDGCFFKRLDPKTEQARLAAILRAAQF